MYFPVAFAVDGDQTTIPNTGSETGTVNFPYGYGSNYSASIESDPDALTVDRLTFNYLMYEMTLNWQALYQTGTVPWITAAENLTVAFDYAANALVLGPDGNNYFSLVGSNTATPGTAPASWMLWNPSYAAAKGEIPLAGVTGGTYSFASLGTGCTLTYTVSAGVINAVSAVAAGGSGYKVGDLITPNGGNYDAVIRVLTLSGSAVATVAILYGGTGFAGATAAHTQNASANIYKIHLAGVLAGNATFIMPNGTLLAAAQEWLIANNTTGAYTTTFQISNGSNVATGTGVIIPQGPLNARATGIDTDGLTDIWASAPFQPPIQTTVAASPGSSLTNQTTVANGSGLMTIPLPVLQNDGDVFQVIGIGAGGWKISQAAGQFIRFGTVVTTTGTGGSLASSNQYDNVTLKYVAALGGYTVTASQGNITYV